MGLIASGQTDIGRKRKSNQDAYYIDIDKKLFIVADGMGGHNGGDIASQIAVNELPHYFIEHIEADPIPLLASTIKEVNSIIKKYSLTHRELYGMGTTVVCAHFRGQNAYIANVGDSRAYLLSQQKIYQLTKDHSLVQEKINCGIYTREQAAFDQQKNVLIKTVGFEDDLEADLFVYKVSKNDMFLFCSDGLHGKVSDEDILFILNQNIPIPERATQKNLDEAVKKLIMLANQNGGQDNITAILVIAQ